ncbi:MAG: hypothetical protein M1831_004309 [Alyxoria varia]|nr:MAG: hypothetical protein M1831_004309 [Alyxoria varia]
MGGGKAYSYYESLFPSPEKGEKPPHIGAVRLTRHPPKQVKRTIRILTEQRLTPDVPSPNPGYPTRHWHIEIWMVHEGTGELVPADCYDKVIYKLHHSFNEKAKQTFKQPPFRCEEDGWGEFDMKIHLSYAGGKNNEHTITHDLNFQQEKYEAEHNVVFKNPKPELIETLRSSGPVPGGEANGVTPNKDSAKKKTSARKDKNIDMDKLAEALQRLTEDDMLHVVQLVHEQKTQDTYVKNDVENGEFHVDLYTLPDALVKGLWDFTAAKVDMSVV